MGNRRPRSPEHPGPRPLARYLDARQCAGRAAPLDQQPQRSCRRLCHHGWDTSGGLAPIAGIDKAYLRTWLRWLERRTAPQGLGHASPGALSAVNAQAPTAELRPPDATQTDETDLMPYRCSTPSSDLPSATNFPPRSLAADRPAGFRSRHRGNSHSGSNGSSDSGAATNGNASVMPPASTSMTRTSIPRPGAAGRSSPAGLKSNSPNSVPRRDRIEILSVAARPGSDILRWSPGAVDFRQANPARSERKQR